MVGVNHDREAIGFRGSVATCELLDDLFGLCIVADDPDVERMVIIEHAHRSNLRGKSTLDGVKLCEIHRGGSSLPLWLVELAIAYGSDLRTDRCHGLRRRSCKGESSGKQEQNQEAEEGSVRHGDKVGLLGKRSNAQPHRINEHGSVFGLTVVDPVSDEAGGEIASLNG